MTVITEITPVLQDRFYEPDAEPGKQRGNCLSAVVASLLSIPLAEVPNFVQDHVDTDGYLNWWNRCWTFVWDHGYEIRYVDPEGEGGPLPGEYYTVSGPSPRDPRCHHIVIHRGGEMVHDPHPDGTGLVSEGESRSRWVIRRREVAA